MRAEYILRFDDFCPTMNWNVWEHVERILLEFKINPIVSVIPDNQDKMLKVCEAKRGFWEDVRTWQDRGWTIGLHGYQHLYQTKNAGLIGLNEFSEFSGLAESEQMAKLSAAMSIFERERIRPDVWVAPGHSFDLVTLNVLEKLELLSISDGFFCYPHRDRFGFLWVPQQLWRFRRMPFGVWTICLHINNWAAAELAKFRADMERFSRFCAEWQTVVEVYGGRPKKAIDGALAGLSRTVVRSRRLLLAPPS